MSSNSHTKEIEDVVFQFDKNAITGMLDKYDPETEIYSKGRSIPTEIDKIIITKDGVQCDPKELSRFIKETFKMV